MIQFFKKKLRSFILQVVFEQEQFAINKDLSQIKLLPNVSIDDSFWHDQYFSFKLQGDRNRVEIGSNVGCRKYCNFLIGPKGTLKIGSKVFFNNFCSVNCFDSIVIGENTLFGEGVKIYDHNHKYSFIEGVLVVEREDFSTSPIRIGKNCWVGSNVTILKGVEIGDNVIIGANCLIYKSIPSNTIVKHSEVIIQNQAFSPN